MLRLKRFFYHVSLLGVFLVVSLSGCSTFHQGIQEIPELPPAPLPRYQVGDRVVYDPPHVEEVIAVDGDRVWWRRDGKTEYLAERNFLLPSIERRSENSAYRYETTITSDESWPLTAGDQWLDYKARKIVEPLPGAERGVEGRERDISCRRAGTARVTVVGGIFDTHRILCDRFRGNREWRPYREWYYAPSIGHWVLRIDYTSRGGPRRRIEMVAFVSAAAGLSPRSQQFVDAQLQSVLTHRKSGDPATAMVTNTTQLEVTTTPIRTLRDRRGGYCRNFVQQIDMGSQSWKRAGLACRDAHGQWRAPDS